MDVGPGHWGSGPFLALFPQVPGRGILRSWTSALRSSWKLTHPSGLRGLSLLEHLASHLLHLALGVHLHILACARLLGYLVGYLIRLTFSVLVRISPRSCLLGYPLPEVIMCSLGIHAALLKRHILHHHFPCLRCSLGFFTHPPLIIG